MQRGPIDALSKRGEGFFKRQGCSSDYDAVSREGGLASIGTVPGVKRLAGRGESDLADSRQSQYRHRHGHAGGFGGAEYQERAESQRFRDREGTQQAPGTRQAGVDTARRSDRYDILVVEHRRGEYGNLFILKVKFGGDTGMIN